MSRGERIQTTSAGCCGPTEAKEETPSCCSPLDTDEETVLKEQDEGADDEEESGSRLTLAVRQPSANATTRIVIWTLMIASITFIVTVSSFNRAAPTTTSTTNNTTSMEPVDESTPTVKMEPADEAPFVKGAAPKTPPSVTS